MSVTDQVVVVAADHPSLDGAVGAFLDELRRERRYFGPTSSTNPKPFPSLVDGLADPGIAAGTHAFRAAAVDNGRVIGMVRVDDEGHVLMAVAADRRGDGVGSVLARHAVDRARRLGLGRLCLRSSRRSRAATALATSMGFMVIDRGLGRLDLVLDLRPASHSA